jgi:hypothetical protein
MTKRVKKSEKLVLDEEGGFRITTSEFSGERKLPVIDYRFEYMPQKPWSHNLVFPPQVWFYGIIQYLNVFDKVRLSRTCWSLRLLIKGDKQIIYCNVSTQNFINELALEYDDFHTIYSYGKKKMIAEKRKSLGNWSNTPDDGNRFIPDGGYSIVNPRPTSWSNTPDDGKVHALVNNKTHTFNNSFVDEEKLRQDYNNGAWVTPDNATHPNYENTGGLDSALKKFAQKIQDEAKIRNLYPQNDNSIGWGISAEHPVPTRNIYRPPPPSNNVGHRGAF